MPASALAGLGPVAETALEVQGLVHRYGATPVLDGVTFTVEKGELVALLGVSGSGKTTVLRAIAGLIEPLRGAILVNGREVSRDGRTVVPVESRRVGLVFQDYALFPHLDVERNVAFGARDKARVAALLAQVELSEHARRRPRELSGGQQQRVALARALAAEPAVLLLDEPFANVDAGLRGRLGRELAATLAVDRTASLMVTHDQSDALAFADRIAVLLPGPEGATIAQIGRPQDVYDRPVSEAVAARLGPHVAIRGEARGEAAVTAVGTFPLAEPAQGPVRVLLRPEDGRAIPDEAGALTVVDRTFLGRGFRLELSGPQVESLSVEHPPDSVPARGARVRIETRRPLHAFR